MVLFQVTMKDKASQNHKSRETIFLHFGYYFITSFYLYKSLYS